MAALRSADAIHASNTDIIIAIINDQQQIISINKHQ